MSDQALYAWLDRDDDGSCRGCGGYCEVGVYCARCREELDEMIDAQNWLYGNRE